MPLYWRNVVAGGSSCQSTALDIFRQHFRVRPVHVETLHWTYRWRGRWRSLCECDGRCGWCGSGSGRCGTHLESQFRSLFVLCFETRVSSISVGISQTSRHHATFCWRVSRQCRPWLFWLVNFCPFGHWNLASALKLSPWAWSYARAHPSSYAYIPSTIQ